MSFTGFDTI